VPDFVTLAYPNCGGKLHITPDPHRFACAHCGSERMVRRGGGVVALAPVVEGLRQVQTGVDKTAAELAIARLTRELTQLEDQHEATTAPHAQWSVNATRLAVALLVAAFVVGAWDFAQVKLTALPDVATIVVLYLVLSAWNMLSVRSRRAVVDQRLDAREAQIADCQRQLNHHRRIVKT